MVVRDAQGDPVVVRNAPFLDDGTPMPTRYYLVGTELVREVSRIEAAGGVRRAEAELDTEAIAATHARYAAERSAAIPDDHVGPTPVRWCRRYAGRREVPARPCRPLPRHG